MVRGDDYSTVPLLGTIVLIGLAFLVVKFAQDPLKDVPGPFWARFTRLWELRASMQGKFEQDNIKLHERYGQ